MNEYVIVCKVRSTSTQFVILVKYTYRYGRLHTSNFKKKEFAQIYTTSTCMIDDDISTCLSTNYSIRGALYYSEH